MSWGVFEAISGESRRFCWNGQELNLTVPASDLTKRTLLVIGYSPIHFLFEIMELFCCMAHHHFVPLSLPRHSKCQDLILVTPGHLQVLDQSVAA
jgi:hypothetical protein